MKNVFQSFLFYISYKGSVGLMSVIARDGAGLLFFLLFSRHFAFDYLACQENVSSNYLERTAKVWNFKSSSLEVFLDKNEILSAMNFFGHSMA